MGTFNVCCRLPLNTSRFQITITDHLSNLDGYSGNILHQEIGKCLGVKEQDFDILYAGQVLKPESGIAEFSLQNQSTLYVVPKFSSNTQMNEERKVNPVHKNEVFMAVQSALLNHDYKSIVERMLTDSDTVENIISSTPGLDKDPCVLAMLLKPELLTILAHPNNMDSLMKEHPSFAQAAITIANAVNEEGTKSGPSTNSAAVSYSLDQMSDEDEDSPGPSRSQGAGRGQNITASQLAAALQAASNQFGSASGMQSSAQSEPALSASGASITSDFFQQAMLQAQNASNDGALQQLRDMGITDENVARQALAATNGDIQAAIDLIFGDGSMQ